MPILIPLVPRDVPYGLRNIFNGASDDNMSSLKFFRDYLPDSNGCQEVSAAQKWEGNLRSFWYPKEDAISGSIQQKIRDFLLLIEKKRPDYWGRVALVQFWVPVKMESGDSVLTVSRQPFAARQRLKGLCWYRWFCQELFRLFFKGDPSCFGVSFGPVRRVEHKGSPEFSPHVNLYSNIDYPLVNHAKHCGLGSYLAIPVFEIGGNGDCVGALEFVSLTEDSLSSFDTRICMEKLKEVGLAFRYPSHPEQIPPLFNFLPSRADDLSPLLDLVRKEYRLPLVQIWLPCNCKGYEVSIACELMSTHMVCGLQSLDRDEWQPVWLSSYARCDSQVYFVEGSESWIGRARVEKKIIFIKDARKYKVYGYPLVSLGRSSDPLACFAVPLQLVDPKLPPLVLEVFLPTKYNSEDPNCILKHILSTFARELSKYNADFGLRNDEEYCIKWSRTGDICAYFDLFVT